LKKARLSDEEDSGPVWPPSSSSSSSSCSSSSSSSYTIPSILPHLLFHRSSDFGNETGTLPNGEFESGVSTLDRMRLTKVLLIGAGGLGCEILKCLALSGFREVHVIDMDQIDLTNLNRQFLFRLHDVGKFKSHVAAAFINKRFGGSNGINVISHVGRVQDQELYPAEFFERFDLVFGGLDNIDARRYINSVLCSFVKVKEDGSFEGKIIPFIDGGTSGFQGQVRLVLPKITPCFECTLAMMEPEVTVPICTLANTPRKPEHCILYALIKMWEQAFPERGKPDTDSAVDMHWICDRAIERAEKFGISGVTYTLTLGVVKNIIPAIASTNALISAACVNEGLKIISFVSQSLDNYFMYGGDAFGGEGIYASRQWHQKAPHCTVCSKPEVILSDVNKVTYTLENLINDSRLNLKKPTSVFKHGSGYIYSEKKTDTHINLSKTLFELGVENGEEVLVLDATVHILPITVVTKYLL